MPTEADQIIAALRSRGSDAWSDECARIGYDPASPRFAEPVTDSQTILDRRRVQQWLYVIEAAEQLLRVASLLVDPGDVEGERMERLKDLLTAPAYESPTTRIDREQSLRSARQNVTLALGLHREMDLPLTPTSGLPELAAALPPRQPLSDRCAGVEARICELLAVDGPRTSAQIAHSLGGLTSQQVAQICNHSQGVEKRRRAGKTHGVLWGAASNGKPHARRKPR